MFTFGFHDFLEKAFVHPFKVKFIEELLDHLGQLATC